MKAKKKRHAAWGEGGGGEEQFKLPSKEEAPPLNLGGVAKGKKALTKSV